MLLTSSPRLCFLLLTGFFVVSGGCREPERPPIVWVGDHIQVGTDLDLDEWCPGTLPLLDSHAGLLKEMFDVPENHIVTHYLYPPPISDRICPKPRIACFLPEEGATFTTDLFDLHEIVHAVQWTHGGMPHVFDEGAATYWGGSSEADGRGLEIRQLLDNAWSGGLGSRDYWLAAKFTAYLIHANGLEPYVALLKATNWDQSRANFAKAFEQAMGMTLDEAIADYEAETEWWYCDTASTQYWFHACAQPGIVIPGGGDMYFDLDVSCADPAVAGPSSQVSPDGAPRIWRDITLELDTIQQLLVLDTPGKDEPSSVIMEIKPCTTDCFEAMSSTLVLHPGEGPMGLAPLVIPGRNVIRVSRAADDPGPVRFRWINPG